jgi:mono/diheme cytochrome c family protein
MHAFVLAGLSTGQKIGIAAVGAAFILFSLVSSFVLPRRNPNFPGRFVGLYVGLGILFVIAMLSAVIVFGKEKEAKGAGESPAHTATVSGSLPGQTTSTPTTTASSSGGGGAGGGASQGNATAGKAVFTSAGCSGCHTLKAAGATGNVGPNLDQLKPSFAIVEHQVIHGGGAMPAFKGQLSDKQIADVAAFVSQNAGS